MSSHHQPVATWLMLLEMDNSSRLEKYHKLLLAVLRIVVSITIACGPQNEQALEQVRRFLVEYRPLTVAIFKRRSNIGVLLKASEDDYRLLDEISEYFVLLISLSDFLEVTYPLC